MMLRYAINTNKCTYVYNILPYTYVHLLVLVSHIAQVTGRLGRRRRKLLDDLKKRRGYSHLKEKALDRSMWKRL
jgi:hypothetical protein